MPALLVARLVVLESIRRRLAITASRLDARRHRLHRLGFLETRRAVRLGKPAIGGRRVAGIVIFMAFMFITVLALAGSLIGATALGTELDNGTLLAILPRPLTRVELLAGKWLGAFAVIAFYGVASIGLEALVVRATTGYAAPQPLFALSFMLAVVAVVITCAMALSVRLAPLTAAIVTVVFYGAAWIDGIAHLIANALGNEGVAQGTLAAALLFPTDGLWRGALYGLEPAAMRAAGLNGPGGAGPFAVLGPPTPAFMIWCGLWLVLVAWLAVRTFRVRDV